MPGEEDRALASARPCRSIAAVAIWRAACVARITTRRRCSPPLDAIAGPGARVAGEPGPRERAWACRDAVHRDRDQSVDHARTCRSFQQDDGRARVRRWSSTTPFGQPLPAVGGAAGGSGRRGAADPAQPAAHVSLARDSGRPLRPADQPVCRGRPDAFRCRGHPVVRPRDERLVVSPGAGRGRRRPPSSRHGATSMRSSPPENVRNVIWSWDPSHQYRGTRARRLPWLASGTPATRYVDWIGIDGYLGHGQTFADVFARQLRRHQGHHQQAGLHRGDRRRGRSRPGLADRQRVRVALRRLPPRPGWSGSTSTGSSRGG